MKSSRGCGAPPARRQEARQTGEGGFATPSPCAQGVRGAIRSASSRRQHVTLQSPSLNSRCDPTAPWTRCAPPTRPGRDRQTSMARHHEGRFNFARLRAGLTASNLSSRRSNASPAPGYAVLGVAYGALSTDGTSRPSTPASPTPYRRHDARVEGISPFVGIEVLSADQFAAIVCRRQPARLAANLPAGASPTGTAPSSLVLSAAPVAGSTAEGREKVTGQGRAVASPALPMKREGPSPLPSAAFRAGIEDALEGGGVVHQLCRRAAGRLTSSPPQLGQVRCRYRSLHSGAEGAPKEQM